MEKITVIIIDDNDKHRNSLKEWLTVNEIKVQESFAHAWFVNYATLKGLPDIAIVSLDIISEAQNTVAFLRKYYPSIKILVLSIREYDHLIINKLGMATVDGMLYKLDIDQYKIINAIKALSEGKKYFES